MDELGIKLSVGLDKSLKSVEDINKQIRELEGKINKLNINLNLSGLDKIQNLNIGFDDKEIQKLQKLVDKIQKSFSSELNKSFKQMNNNADSLIMDNIKNEIARYSNLQDRINEIKKDANSLSQITVSTKKDIDDIERAVIKYRDALGRTITETYKLINQGKKIDSSDSSTKPVMEWELVNNKAIDNVEQQEKAEENLRQKRDQLLKQLRTLELQGKITTETFKKMSNAINTRDDIQQLNKLNNTIKMLDRNASRKITPGELIASDSSLKDLNGVTSKQLEDILRANQAIGDQRVLASSLNTVTGKWSITIRENSKEQRTLTGIINTTNGAIYKQTDALKELSGHHSKHLGFIQQVGIAISRTFTWATAMTGFYGTIRGIQNMLQEVISIDQAMTELKRVMDATPKQYNDMLQQSIELSKQLGNNVHDVLDSLTEVARSYGNTLSQADMLKLTKTSILASNVSDLSPADAMKDLIGTMNAYKISAQDSIQIIDKLNEVDNNYSVSTQQIADAMSKSASVAKVYGVSLDELVGNITAIGSTTQESGEQIGRALKTIYSRITTLGQAKDALDSVGVSIYDMNNKVKPVSEILSELAKKWKGLSDEQRQNVAVNVAGRDQLTRFLALMENWDTSIKATQTSMNSAGSAMQENEKYLNSIQAKINELQTAFTELSLAVGKAFLTDGFIGAVEILKGMAEGGAKVASVVGVLPIVFGIAGAAAITLSKNFRKAVTEMTIFGAMSEGLTISTAALATALRGLAAATGVGLIFAGIGFAAEKLIGHFTEAKKKEEEFQQKQQDMVDSFKSHEKSIEELADQYEKYEQKISSGHYDVQDLQQFNDIRRQLASLMPTLIVGEDAYGNKIIGTSSSIKEQIKLLKEQIETQKQVDAIKKEKEVKKEYDDAIKNYKKAQSKKDEQWDDFLYGSQGILGKIVPSTSNSGIMNGIKTIDDLNKKLDEYEKKRQKLLAQGKDLNPIDKHTYNLLKDQKEQMTEMTAEVQKSSILLGQAAKDYIQNMMQADKATNSTTDSIVTSFATMVSSSGASADKVRKTLDDLVGSLDSKKFKSAFNGLSDAIDEYDAAVSKGLSDKELKKYADNVEKQFDRVKKVLLGVAKTQLGGNSKAYKELNNELNALLPSLIGVGDESDKAADKQGKLSQSVELSSDEIVRNAVANYESSKAIDTNTKATDDNTKSKYDNMSANEILTQKYNETADSVAVYNGLLEDMANGKRLSAAEAMDLISKESDLASAITVENGVVKINKDAVTKLRDAKIASYQDMLNATQQEAINTANATISNLQNYGLQIQAIENLQDAKRRLAELSDLRDIANSGMGDWGTRDEVNKAYDQVKSVVDLYQNVENLKKLASQSLKQVGTATDKSSRSTKEHTKAAKSDKDAIDEQTNSYRELTDITDKYKVALDNVNNALDQQEKLYNKIPKWHEQYRMALDKEVKLLQQKKALLQEESAELKNQIAINSTLVGQVYTGSGSVSSSGGGTYTGKYASYINAAAKKYGVDPLLIAAVIKQESQFNPNAVSPAGAKGLMQLMPKTARSMGVSNPFNAYQNIMGGTKYLKQLLDQFHSISLALAAYNAGPGNVTKYGGIPPFSETQKYVRLVTGYYSDFKRAYAGGSVSVSTSLGGSVLPGWGGQITSGYGMRNGVMHRGIDIAGSRGQTLASNVAGTVVFAGLGTKGSGYGGYGNVVAIKDSNGYVHLYGHLSKVLVKKGDRVSVGTKIGALGSTGNSTGVHLHYEIRKNGQLGNTINPISYVNKAKNTYVDAVADTVTTINDLRSQYSSVQSDIAGINDRLEEIRYEKIESTMAVYEKRINDVQNKIDTIDNKLKNYAEYTTQYRQLLYSKYKDIGLQRRQNASEIAYVKSVLKSGKLNLAKLYEYQQKLNDLLKQRDELYAQQQEVYGEIINSTLSTYEKRISDLQNQVDALDAKLGNYDQSSPSYRNVLISKENAIYGQRRQNASEIAYLQSVLKAGKLTNEQLAEYRQKLNELLKQRDELLKAQQEVGDAKVDSYISEMNDLLDRLNSALTLSRSKMERMNKESHEYAQALAYQDNVLQEQIDTLKAYQKVLDKVLKTETLSSEKKKDLEKQLSDINQQIEDLTNEQYNIRSDLADQYIDVIKSAIQKEQELKTNALQKEMDDLEKAHQEKLDMWDKEVEAFEKAINEQMALIDEQYDEDQYNKNMNDLLKQQAKLQKEKNRLMLDDSQESKAKRVEIEQQLQDIQDQIDQARYDREVELRKKNLQDQLDNYKEDVDAKKDAEDQLYEDQKDSLQKQLDEWNYYYNELLNDEKYFNDLRQQILDGHLEEAQQKLQEYLDHFKEYNQDTVKEIESSWTDLQSLIDKIQHLQDTGSTVTDPNNDDNSGILDSAKEADFKRYLENKRLIQFENPTEERKAQLKEENDMLRTKWGFEDGSYLDLLKKYEPDEYAVQRNKAFQQYLTNKRLAEFNDPTPERAAQLKKENEKLRSLWGFQDGSYLQLLKQYDINRYNKERAAAWQQYLTNKRLAEKNQPTPQRAAELKAENTKLRQKWGFPDGSYDNLKNLKKYHDGGIIGGKGNRLAEVLNKLANGNPNEVTVKALLGEVFIPPKNIGNLFKNLGTMLMPNFTIMTPTPATEGGDITLQINIDTFYGTKENVDNLSTTIVNKLKNRGLK
ncbi:phage tail tape measure protein [Bacillus smithii]|uniref:phage tail tape measure protein n=1 Tax=Bacillus smithii TaxID=1479 RepID=UPI003D2156AA